MVGGQALLVVGLLGLLIVRVLELLAVWLQAGTTDRACAGITDRAVTGTADRAVAALLVVRLLALLVVLVMPLETPFGKSRYVTALVMGASTAGDHGSIKTSENYSLPSVKFATVASENCGCSPVGLEWRSNSAVGSRSKLAPVLVCAVKARLHSEAPSCKRMLRLAGCFCADALGEYFTGKAVGTVNSLFPAGLRRCSNLSKHKTSVPLLLLSMFEVPPAARRSVSRCLSLACPAFDKRRCTAWQV